MKKLLTHLLLLFPFCTFSQINKCYTDHAKQNYLNSDNAMHRQYLNQEAAVRQWISANKDLIKNQKNSVVVQIPVVFHVVYKNATQDIADSNIFRQVDILNDCFRLQNSNFSQTRAIFDTIAADVEVEFCLATTDPAGNPTTGITKTQAPAGSFFDPILGFDNVKSSATGGKDPWPSDQYLNVWVCDMSFLGLVVVLGYATFPGGDPTVDGVVIQYNFIGFQTNGTTNEMGRTTVHEVGHWMGLRHIWGDGQLSAPLCDSTDYVDDTPNADTASQQSCVIKNTCSNESPYWTLAGIDPPDMIENYMDYSYDECMTMFTEGQKVRMLGFLNTTRASILTSPGCSTTSVNEIYLDVVSVYPNPAKEKVVVDPISDQPFYFTLSDVTGRLLQTFLISGKTELDISGFSNGVLLYETEQSGKQSFGKILKTDF